MLLGPYRWSLRPPLSWRACLPYPQPRLDNRTVPALSFWHSMTWHTEGISVTAPVKWRQLDGLVSAFWEAESQMGLRVIIWPPIRVS